MGFFLLWRDGGTGEGGEKGAVLLFVVLFSLLTSVNLLNWLTESMQTLLHLWKPVIIVLYYCQRRDCGVVLLVSWYSMSYVGAFRVDVCVCMCVCSGGGNIEMTR